MKRFEAAPSFKGQGRKPPTRLVNYKNFTLTVYSIAWLKYVMGRATFTLRQWERRGVLPKPLLNLGDSTRWYTAAELLGYAEIFQNCRTSAMRTSFKAAGFPQKCRELHHKLRLTAQTNPAVLKAKLPTEDAIKKIIEQNRGMQFAAQLS